MLSRPHRGLFMLCVVLGLAPRLARAQWVDNGVPVCTAPGGQDIPLVAPDGAGGVFVAWRDLRNGNQADVYVQHLTATGYIAPGWPVDGLAVCTAPNLQGATSLISDGDGGALLGWEGFRKAQQTLQDIYAQRITASGQVAAGRAGERRGRGGSAGFAPNHSR